MADKIECCDKYGHPVHPGNKIHMPGVPFVVTVLTLEQCEPNCRCGAAGIKDPETGALDQVCLSQFVVL